jgi:hypothetical protein
VVEQQVVEQQHQQQVEQQQQPVQLESYSPAQQYVLQQLSPVLLSYLAAQGLYNCLDLMLSCLPQQQQQQWWEQQQQCLEQEKHLEGQVQQEPAQPQADVSVDESGVSAVAQLAALAASGDTSPCVGGGSEPAKAAPKMAKAGVEAEAVRPT